MIKRLFGVLTVVILLAAPLGTALATQSLYGPTEVLYYDREKADDGYVLFGARDGFTYLIDKEGRAINIWPSSGFRLQDNGNLVTTYRVGDARGHQELDWDGNQVWYWLNTEAGRPELRPHHDYEKIVNPKTGIPTLLFVARNEVSYADAKAAGADDECNLRVDTDDAATPFYLGEVDMAGNIIWEWRIWDHVVQGEKADGVINAGTTNERSTYVPYTYVYGLNPTDRRVLDYGRLDLNVDTNGRTGLTRDWNHVNSMGYNPTLDQICFNSREHGEFYVVDHSLTTEQAATETGDFVYRWGNPSNYGVGDAPTWNNNGHEQLWGAHNIHWIDEGLPGAGNFLVFENGSRRTGQFPQHSSVFEINPYDGPMADGIYIRQSDAGYEDTGTTYGNLSDQVVWKYSGVEPAGTSRWCGIYMYSSHISGCHRLPNGNTLIIAGEGGNVVEVTPDHEVVWNYIMPIVSDGEGGYIAKAVHGPADASNLFRAYAIPKDHPGLVGKDLTPSATTLVGFLPGTNALTHELPPVVPITGWGIPAGTTSEGGGGGASGTGSGGDEGGGY